MSVGLEPLPEEEGCGAAGTKVCARSANNHHYAAFNGQRFNNMTTETTTTSWSLKLEESDYCRSSDSGFVEGCSNLNLTMEAEVIAAKAASSAQWAKTKRKNSAIWNFWISARGAIKLHPPARVPCFTQHLCQRDAILLRLSHLCSNLLLHYFSMFSLLCNSSLPPKKRQTKNDNTICVPWGR